MFVILIFMLKRKFLFGKMLVLCVLLLCWQATHATFNFPPFTSSAATKPLMAALGSSLQHYLSLGRIASTELPSHSPGYLLPATATVGIGTILQHPPVKAVPYGLPRPVAPLMRGRPSHVHRNPVRPLHSKLAPVKSSHYGPTKMKFQHVNSVTYHEKEMLGSPGFKELPQRYYLERDNSQHTVHASYKLPVKAEHHSEVLHSSYTAHDEPSRAPVIVYQGVRPPVRFYQEPHPTAAAFHSNQVSPTSAASHDRADKSSGDSHFPLDYSRPDPVFSTALNSDWKPINVPSIPARVYSASAAERGKQLSDDSRVQQEPAEESVVSAVVFVKQ